MSNTMLVYIKFWVQNKWLEQQSRSSIEVRLCGSVSPRRALGGNVIYLSVGVSSVPCIPCACSRVPGQSMTKRTNILSWFVGKVSVFGGRGGRFGGKHGGLTGHWQFGRVLGPAGSVANGTGVVAAVAGSHVINGKDARKRSEIAYMDARIGNGMSVFAPRNVEWPVPLTCQTHYLSAHPGYHALLKVKRRNPRRDWNITRNITLTVDEIGSSGYSPQRPPPSGDWA